MGGVGGVGKNVREKRERADEWAQSLSTGRVGSVSLPPSVLSAGTELEMRGLWS